MDFWSAFEVLNPKGFVALAERDLMIHAIEFMLIVAIPVYILLFFFAWKYRAKNKKESTYMPDWEHGKLEELVWWAIPFEIILVLGALTWTSTHQLDPRKPLSNNPPLVVEVVSLNWKWLFIYPEQDIATINYVRIPVDRPVEFKVTADSPMNSFWIPQLGGQIYAMTGMVNKINLIANEKGTYTGRAANYTGDGFAHMQFATEAIPVEEFNSWVVASKARSKELTKDEYAKLAQSSVLEATSSYSGVEDNLYGTIVMKFMDSQGNSH